MLSKKNFIIVILILVIFVFGLIRFLFRDSKKNTNINTPTPTLVPTSMPTTTKQTIVPTKKIGDSGVGYGPDPTGVVILMKEKEENKKQYPLFEYLPYKNNDFTVDHYVEPLKLVIYIKNEEVKNQVENQVKEWIKSKGFDENSHTFSFVVKK